MIVVDTSALVAILRQEDEADRLYAAIEYADAAIASSMTIFAARVVAMRQFSAAFLDHLNHFLIASRIEQVPFDDEQGALAAQAYRRFGRGSGHPARLNLGDCASYALAMSLDAPLLYKGNDFSQTDVRSALAA